MSKEFTNFTQTSIDLGDDLLEKTAMTPAAEARASDAPEPSRLAVESPEDGMASAKILINEGLLEEAKRVLHRVLVLAPSNARAKRMLSEVHEKELQQIFSDAPKRKGVLGDFRLNRRTWIDTRPSDQILGDLDRDLGLGLSLLDELAAARAHSWSETIDRDLGDLSPSDRIDMAVAFLEMGLFDAAARVLSPAILEGGKTSFVASCLYATAKIGLNDGFSAALTLEPVVSDVDIETSDKIEVYYLLGRAAETVANRELAMQWYGEVIRLDTDYRDAAERLNRLR